MRQLAEFMEHDIWFDFDRKRGELVICCNRSVILLVVDEVLAITGIRSLIYRFSNRMQHRG